MSFYVEKYPPYAICKICMNSALRQLGEATEYTLLWPFDWLFDMTSDIVNERLLH